MTRLVANGALLGCSCGTVPSRLVVNRPVRSDTQPIATVEDRAPLTNIFPFGMCLGMRAACMPHTAPRWAGASTARINGVALLTEDALVLCQFGGVITVAEPNCRAQFQPQTGIEPVKPVEVYNADRVQPNRPR